MDRKWFREARQMRGLSLADVAKDLTTRMGFKVHRATLANWELGRTDEPRLRVMRAIEVLGEEWRQDGGRSRFVAREDDTYQADHDCPCGAYVPGPLSGAKHCLACGRAFGPLECHVCGVAVAVGMHYCGVCGTPVTTVTLRRQKHAKKR